jgi:hypothetical protein
MKTESHFENVKRVDLLIDLSIWQDSVGIHLKKIKFEDVVWIHMAHFKPR